MEHKSIEVDGVTMLAIKWQDSRGQPALKIMAVVSHVHAEVTIGFAARESLDLAFDDESSEMFKAFAASAKGTNEECADDEEDEPEDDECPTCMGTGEGMYDGSSCSACRGRGY